MFWASITVSIIVSVISISFDACKKPDGTPADPSNQSELSEAASSGISETVYTSEYSSVKISFDSENSGFKLTDAFEATDPRVVAYIDSTIRTSISSKHIEDPEKYPTDQNNSTEQYTIKLSNKVDGYSCGLYYDDLYDMACIEKDGGYFDVGTDFARYIDSLFENTDIDFGIDKTDAVLFKEYGWTLDYRISEWKNNINDINLLCDFDPNAYYFAYNNELSKDIGLDMSRISGNADIEVEIYRIRESMPQEFYPIKTCRGIVVKTDGKIIGAFIITGRGNMLYACSLKGNSFESVTGKTIYEWLAIKVKADSTEESLSELEPELIIKEYFMALDNKDANGAAYCIS